jgi:hypothetical protein
LTGTLLLKLILTPLLIASATVAGRRWGENFSGWLVGLPFTSGPVIFFLALDQGTPFASTAALGVMLGVISQAAFGLAYVYATRTTAGWLKGVLAGTAAFTLATIIFLLIKLPTVFEAALVLLSLLLAIKLMPARRTSQPSNPPSRPALDLLLRTVTATALVIALTSLGPLLGPRLIGLLSPYPLYAAILAVFAHRQSGPSAASAVWHGLLYGLFAFGAFFLIAAAVLVRLGIGPSLLLATLAALAIEAITLQLLRARPRAYDST